MKRKKYNLNRATIYLCKGEQVKNKLTWYFLVKSTRKRLKGRILLDDSNRIVNNYYHLLLYFLNVLHNVTNCSTLFLEWTRRV